MNAEQINKYNEIANKKDKWDLEERKGFKKKGDYYIYVGRNSNYGNKKNKKIPLLYYIDNQIRLLQNLCEMYSHSIPEPYQKSQFLLLANTPHKVQEIPPRSGFLGINKPKVIEDLSVFDGILLPEDRPDRLCRARYRLVMLQLEKTTKKDLTELLIHELAHGGCNHLIYMNKENHLDDFKTCEKNIKTLVDKHRLFCDLDKFLE